MSISSLRLVLFAGEVFPVKHLREVTRRWPRPVYYNLYGPTETNVCTFARIPLPVPDERDTPYPIGFACAHCQPLVLDADGQEVNAGDEGLLYISGPSVFDGYWNRPAENARAFIERDGRRRGSRWADRPEFLDDMKRKVPETFGACFDLIEREMFAGPWVMGESYTIADPYLFTIASWLEGMASTLPAIRRSRSIAGGWPSAPRSSAPARPRRPDRPPLTNPTPDFFARTRCPSFPRSRRSAAGSRRCSKARRSSGWSFGAATCAFRSRTALPLASRGGA